MDSKLIVNTVEILEPKALNDLVSEVVIKVCWVSDEPNANSTVITREVGKQLAATLPGAPIAGYFDKSTDDFEEHSRRISYQDGKLHIEDVTKPYGFVAPEPAWFQNFEEDGVEKTYLMCRGYLWTRQYEEAQRAFGKGQSMELAENSIEGYYKGDTFIFTSASIDKLCILGDDYPPCFSGAQILDTNTPESNQLVEELQEILGRRFYVMQGQLKEKTETPALDYALSLGYELFDAVSESLRARGVQNFDIVGIYAEGGEVFTVYRDLETNEMFKVGVVFTEADQVALTPEVISVRQIWVPAATLKTGEYSAAQVEAAEEPSEAAEAIEAAEVAEEALGEAAETEEPVVEFVEENNTNEEVEQLQAKIAELEAELADFRQREVDAEAERKEALVEEYSALLPKADIESVGEVSQYSAEELEAKFAVMFARRSKNSNPTYQVNIASTLPAESVEPLPAFMQAALNYEKNNSL